MSATETQAVCDAIAQVIAGAIAGHIFAAGVTQSVTDATPLVVPLADDFTEVGLPAVTVAMAPWELLPQPGNQRKHKDVLCAIWRPRVPLGDNVALLYADCDAVTTAFQAHAKAGNVVAVLQSAILAGGPGIVPRALGDPANQRVFLTLPFTVRVVINQTVIFRPE